MTSSDTGGTAQYPANFDIDVIGRLGIVTQKVFMTIQYPAINRSTILSTILCTLVLLDLSTVTTLLYYRLLSFLLLFFVSSLRYLIT